MLCVFYATPTLGFYKSEEKTSIYLLQVPHQDFNKGCDVAKIINDCSLFHLSRIFVLWQFISERMLLNVTIIFHRKMIVWQISHFNKSVIVQIHEHRNAKSNIWLNYTSNSLETSEFFGIFWSSLQQATLEKVHISIGNNISLNSYYHMWYVVHYKNIMYLRYDIHILLPRLYMGFNQIEMKHV